ncbi:MAG TPA: hypothetical protein VGH36_05285, partial [Acetobacteraceae bacterium]
MTQHPITDAEYAAALAAGQSEAEAEVRAQAVRYPVFADWGGFRSCARCRSTGWPERSALQGLAGD